MALGGVPTGDPIMRRQRDPAILRPVAFRTPRTTIAREPDVSADQALARSETPQRAFEAPLAAAIRLPEISSDSTPLQIWEGTVIDFDRTAGTMHVLLDAKIGQVPRHTAEIDLQWVSEQDQDLVCQGAVFYLTLFKRTRPSVENAQELRFRRRPSWSTTQLKNIEKDAEILLSKMKVLPPAA